MTKPWTHADLLALGTGGTIDAEDRFGEFTARIATLSEDEIALICSLLDGYNDEDRGLSAEDLAELKDVAQMIDEGHSPADVIRGRPLLPPDLDPAGPHAGHGQAIYEQMLDADERVLLGQPPPGWGGPRWDGGGLLPSAPPAPVLHLDAILDGYAAEYEADLKRLGCWTDGGASQLALLRGLSEYIKKASKPAIDGSGCYIATSGSAVETVLDGDGVPLTLDNLGSLG